MEVYRMSAGQIAMYEMPTTNRNRALLIILIWAIFILAWSLFLISEFVIRASPTPAKTTNVAAASPPKILAKILPNLVFYQSTSLETKTLIRNIDTYEQKKTLQQN